MGVELPRLMVGLDAWMVLFGAVPDLGVDDTGMFGLRAIPVVARPTSEQSPSMRHMGMSYYAVRGALVLDEMGQQVLETLAGPVHLGEGVLPHRWEGGWIEGEVELLVDADAADSGRPLRLWRIHTILRETQNWRDRRTEENRPITPGRRLLKFSRLLESPGLRFKGQSVWQTNAFSDDAGLAHYNLEIEGC